MTREELLQQIVALPPEAQQRVENLVTFLARIYSRPPRDAEPPGNLDQGSSFIGMWRDREELSDSSDWVRRTRESEWVK